MCRRIRPPHAPTHVRRIARVARDKLHSRVMEISGDPLPYGIAPNRKTLEELIQHAQTQRIITKPVAVEDLFARGTQGLVG